MKRFDGRVAVVTGAASGIGRALASELARRGCDLALADLDPEGLARTAAMVREQGRRATEHEVDVSSRAGMEAFAAEVERLHGRVDVLVNNAGVSVAAPFMDHEIEDLEWVVGVNLWGTLYGCKLFLPLLVRQDEAYIVNLSSMFGLVGVPNQSSYCTTKFAIRGLSESLAAELGPTSVRVLSVHPGAVATNIARGARVRGEGAERRRDESIRFFETRGRAPEDVARRIVAAMERGAERLLVTPEAHVADALKRVFPSMPARWISWAQGRISELGRRVKS